MPCLPLLLFDLLLYLEIEMDDTNNDEDLTEEACSHIHTFSDIRFTPLVLVWPDEGEIHVIVLVLILTLNLKTRCSYQYLWGLGGGAAGLGPLLG